MVDYPAFFVVFGLGFAISTDSTCTSPGRLAKTIYNNSRELT
jgi:hypothetical protein